MLPTIQCYAYVRALLHTLPTGVLVLWGLRSGMYYLLGVHGLPVLGTWIVRVHGYMSNTPPPHALWNRDLLRQHLCIREYVLLHMHACGSTYAPYVQYMGPTALPSLQGYVLCTMHAVCSAIEYVVWTTSATSSWIWGWPTGPLGMVTLFGTLDSWDGHPIWDPNMAIHTWASNDPLWSTYVL